MICSCVPSSQLIPLTGNLKPEPLATTVLPVLDATQGTGMSQRVKGEPEDQMEAEILVKIEKEADGLTAIHPSVAVSGTSITNHCSAGT